MFIGLGPDKSVYTLSRQDNPNDHLELLKLSNLNVSKRS